MLEDLSINDDDISLVYDDESDQLQEPVKLRPRKEIEGIDVFLSSLKPNAKDIHSDSRKAWLHVMEERDRSKKKLSEAKARIKHWTS